MYEQRLGLVPSDYNYREDILALELDRVFKPSWLDRRASCRERV